MGFPAETGLSFRYPALEVTRHTRTRSELDDTQPVADWRFDFGGGVGLAAGGPQGPSLAA
jgi:hypothetical protein